MAAWIPAGDVLADVVRLAAGILLLVASWIGWGYWAGFLIARGPERESLRFFDHGVAGVAAVFVLGALLNQFIALGSWTGDASMAAGLAGFVGVCLRRRAAGKPWRAQALTGLFVALWLAAGIRCISPHYDSGLYHLPFIEWLRAGPLPLGLANVHVRFGYFSSWLVVSAAEGASRLHPDLLYLMNGAAGLLGLGALIETSLPALRSGRWSFSSLFSMASAILLAAAAYPLFFSWMGASPSPDVPAALFALVALVRLAELLEKPEGTALGTVTVGLLAAALAMTIKVSQAPALLAAAGAAVWARLGLRHGGGAGLRRPICATAALLVVWEAGGLLVSGCLLFPIADTCLAGVPWHVDPVQAAAEAARVAAWARAPGPMFREVQEAWQWVPYWRELMWPNRPVLLHLLVAGGAMSLLAATLRPVFGGGRAQPGERRAFATVAATSVAGIAITALAAPDPRFCLAFLTALPAAIVSCLLAGPAHRVPEARAAAGAALVLLLGGGLFNLWLAPACSECCGWRRLPAPRTQVQTTEAGLEIQVPVDTDQCWATTPPCSPEFPASLQEREYFGRRAFLAGNGVE